jgi:alkylation response protein AidB-like acyl-CoA dehydrogenase
MAVATTHSASEEFRVRARSWLQAHAPQDWRERLASATDRQVADFYIEWALQLHGAGLLVPHWPQEFGGGGYGIQEQLVVQQEMRKVGAPRPRTLQISLNHAAATLMRHGTPTQKNLVGGILEGDVWCQGFSEPDAGSDLASLRTLAARHGETYVVNGQKIWSSFAAHAQWCLLLARTDPTAPKHAGISFFLMRMDSPGVTVRPIRQSTGHREFCEIFLDDVVIPVEFRLGAEGDGWRLARTTLVSERVLPMLDEAEDLRAAVRTVAMQIAEADHLRGHARDGLVDRLTEVAIGTDVLAASSEKAVAEYVETGALGATAPILKLYHSELVQRLTGIAAEVGGVYALIDPGDEVRDLGYLSGDWFTDHMRSWTFTIAAGTSEIQRNLIAERVLGLPR